MLLRARAKADAPEQWRALASGAEETLRFGHLVDLCLGKCRAYRGHRLLRSLGECLRFVLAGLRGRRNEERHHAQETPTAENRAVNARSLHRIPPSTLGASPLLNQAFPSPVHEVAAPTANLTRLIGPHHFTTAKRNA